MSASIESVVEIQFLADQESLIAALREISDSANDVVSQMQGGADDMSASLDAVGGSADQLSLNLKDIGASVDSAAATVDGATTDMDGALSVVDATATGLSERLGSIAEGSTTAAGQVSGAASKMDDALLSVDDTATGLADRLASVGDGAGAAAAEVDTAADSMDTSLDGVAASADAAESSIAGGAFKKIALAVLAATAITVDFASKYDDAMKAYVQAAEDAGDSQAKATETLKAAVGPMANIGFNSTQTAQALGTFALAGITGKKATDDLGIAADLARAKNISLSDAVGILTKANAGSTRALTQLGINIDVGTGKLHAIQTASEGVTSAQLNLKTVTAEIATRQITGAQAAGALAAAHQDLSNKELALHQDQGTVAKIMDTVNDRTKGQAHIFGTTLSGSLDIAKAKLHNLTTTIGEELIPVLEKIVKVGGDVIEFFARNKVASVALAVVLGGVLLAGIVAGTAALVTMLAGWVATTASIVAAGAAAVVTGALMIAPFLPVIAVVAAVVAAVAAIGFGIYELVDHWTAVWSTIKSIVSDAVDFIKDHWELIAEILLAPIAPVLALFIHFHDQIIGIFQDAWNGIKSAWDDVTGFFSGIVDDIKGVFTGAADWLYGVGHAIIEGLVNGIKDATKDVTSAVGDVVKGVKSVVTLGGLIGSPSPWFRTVGHAIGEGLVGGVEDSASTVHAAVSKLSNTVTAAFTPALSVGGVGASAGASVVAQSVGSTASGSSSGGSSAPVIVQLIVDGTKLAEATFADFQTVFLQKGRVGKTVQARL